MNAHPVFRPRHRVRGEPHVVVDSLPVEGTQFVLSHWPSVRNPVAVASDTSTGIVLDYLAEAGRWPEWPWVTAGHLDVDALLSLHVAVCPEQRSLGPFWRTLARAGDFRIAADEPIRHALLAVEAQMAQMARVPRPADEAAVFEAMLGWLDVHGPALARGAWPAELDAPVARSVAHGLHSAQRLDASGAFRLWPGADLASLSLDVGGRPGEARPDLPYLGLDEFAVHARCGEFQVLLSHDGAHRLDQRYESWVQGPDPGWACRRDLQPLCNELAALDPDAGWQYDGVHRPFASLRTTPGRRSRLHPTALAERCAGDLRRRAPGWDPHCMGLAPSNTAPARPDFPRDLRRESPRDPRS